MEKEITLCFSTTPAISKSLEVIAAENKVSVSSLIDSILQNHLKESKPFKKTELDRRRSPRKTVSLAAYLGNPTWQRRDFQEVTILDLSINGVRFSIPSGTKLDIANSSDIDKYIVIFRLPDYSWPLNIHISPQRIFETDKEIQVGASLLNPDYCAYTALQNYLA